MKPFLILLLIFFGATTSIVDAKDYKIKQLHIVATILESGDVLIEENRVFEFDGSFSWVEWTLSKRGFGDFSLLDATIDGESVSRISSGSQLNTYRLYDSMRSNYKVRWNFEARDESKNIGLSYMASEAIAGDDEWAEFYWIFLGRGWEEDSQNVRIEIRFERPVEDDFLHAWTKHHFEPFTLKVENSSVIYTAESIRRSRELGIRTVFPVSLVDQFVAADSPINPIEIEADYAQWIADREARAERRKEMEPFVNNAGLALIIFSFLFTIIMIFKYGRNPQISQRIPSLISEPPEDLTPAVAGLHFYNYEVYPVHLSATILNLAKKGYLRVKQAKEGKKPTFAISGTGKEPVDLKPWELYLLDFLNKRVQNEEVNMDELFKVDKKSENFSDLLSGEKSVEAWYAKFRKKVKDAYRDLEWHQSNTKIIGLKIGIQSILLALSIPVIIYGTPPFGYLLLILSILGIALSAVLQPRTEAGQVSYLKWKAYRNAIKSGQVTKGNKAEHFIYSVAFGLNADKISKSLNMSLSDDDLSWLMLMPGTTFNPALLSSGLVTPLQTSVSSTVSVSVGVAGGGTGGGAG